MTRSVLLLSLAGCAAGGDREVVRQCLHRDGDELRDTGFVRLQRDERIHVDYSAIEAVELLETIDIDLSGRLQWLVRLSGRFMARNESDTSVVSSLDLTFDDEATARALAEALERLRRSP